MRPIRTRITMAFAGAFIASLFVFAVAILIARRDAAIAEIAERAQQEVEQTVQLMERTRSAASPRCRTRCASSSTCPSS